MTGDIKLEQVAKTEGCSFLVRYDHIPYHQELGYHCHPEIEIQYVAEGTGMHLIGDIVEPCNEGEIILVPSSIPHGWFYSPKNKGADEMIREYAVQFEKEFICEGISSFPELQKCANFLLNLTDAIEIKGECARRISKRIEAMTSQDKTNKLLLLLNILHEISICHDMRHIRIKQRNWIPNKEMDRLQQVYDYMINHCHEQIALETIAGIACMNKSAFCTFFKKMSGKTFTYSLNELRINLAASLLGNEPNTLISEIAYRTGFSDLPHFNHVFQRFKGCSPSTYRKSYNLHIIP